MSRDDPGNISIAITLGAGQDLCITGITDDNHLVVVDRTGYRIDLGLATKARLSSIQEYIERLKIHASEP